MSKKEQVLTEIFNSDYQGILGNPINARFEKYRQNLRREGNFIISYKTKVAEIKGNELHKIAWNVGGRTSSPTTSKHINYVARELNLEII